MMIPSWSHPSPSLTLSHDNENPPSLSTKKKPPTSECSGVVLCFIYYMDKLSHHHLALPCIHPSIHPTKSSSPHQKKKTKQNSRTFCFMIFTHILSFSFWRLTGSERPTTGFVTKEITSGESSCFDIACRNTSCCIDLATCNLVTSFEQ